MAFQQFLTKITADSPNYPVVIIATAPSSRQLTSDMHEGFLHHVHVEVLVVAVVILLCMRLIYLQVPNEGLRSSVLKSMLTAEQCTSDVSVKHLAQRTAVS